MIQAPDHGHMRDTSAVQAAISPADSVVGAGPVRFDGGTLRPDGIAGPFYGDAAPEAVFGPSSYTIHPGHFQPRPQDPFSGDILWQLAVLALFAVYSYIIFRYLTEAGQLLRLMAARKKEGRSSADFQGVLSPFTNAMIVVSLFSGGLASARMMGLAAAADGNIQTGVPPLLGAVMAAVFFGATGIIQHLLLKGIGSLTFSEDTVAGLLWQKRIFIVALALVATPLVLAMGLASVEWAVIFCLILLCVVLVLLIWFAYKTMRLFIGQKISILFWILYLCLVELMPYCIVILVLLRREAI